MAQRFVIPTPDQVTEYAKTINFRINGEQFCAHYESVGWKVGRNHSPMKSWKAAVRTWKCRTASDPKAYPDARPPSFYLCQVCGDTATKIIAGEKFCPKHTKYQPTLETKP